MRTLRYLPIADRKSIQAWPSGARADSEDTLHFAVLTGVRPMIETFLLARAAEAYDCMITGKAQFRAVLTLADLAPLVKSRQRSRTLLPVLKHVKFAILPRPFGEEGESWGERGQGSS